MLTEREKAIRRTCLGSSEIALLALGPQYANQSLFELYLDKIGAPLPPAESDAMSLGSFLEDGIAKMFSYKTNHVIAKGSHTFHPTESWIGCSPDYEVWTAPPLSAAPAVRLGPVECKCYRWSEEWGAHEEPEAVPAAILCQVQWQLACMQCEQGWVAALVGGDYRHYPIPRCEPLIQRLMALGREFWFECVLARKPPEPTWTLERTGDILAALNPVARDLVALPVEADPWAAQYLEANAAITHLEKEKTAAKNHLLSYLADAQLGILADGRKVNRKPFRVQKPKE